MWCEIRRLTSRHLDGDYWSALSEKLSVSRKFSAHENQRRVPKQISVRPSLLQGNATDQAALHRLQVAETD